MAAPVIAGGVAVMRQMWPYLKAGEISTIMFDTADKSFAGYDKERHGQGIMDLDEATAPQGTLSVANSNSVRDKANKNITQSNMVIKSSGLNLSSLNTFVAIDDYDRNFNIPFNAITVNKTNPTGKLVLDDNSVFSSYLAFSESPRFKIKGYEASISENFNKVSVNKDIGSDFYVGGMYEKNGFLGNESDNALMGIDNSKTAYVGKKISYNPSKKLNISGDLTVGYTDINISQQSMLTDMDSVLSSSAKLSADYKINNESNIIFSFNAPVAINNGDATFNVPSSVDESGNINYETKDINLAYNSRQTSFGVNYKHNGTYKDLKYSLGISSNRVLNKYNLSNNNDTEAKIDFSVKF